MSGWFGSTKIKDPEPVVVPPATPPAGTEDDQIKELKKKKRGHRANLMTGGKGLAAISEENLYSYHLGGSTQTGMKSNA